VELQVLPQSTEAVEDVILLTWLFSEVEIQANPSLSLSGSPEGLSHTLRQLFISLLLDHDPESRELPHIHIRDGVIVICNRNQL
jgi:hypothetical protein